MIVPSAVIFDMDGVLIDARDWHFRALNESLEIFGESISSREHEEVFDGLPTKVKLEILSEQKRIPSHLHSVIEAIKQERTLREAARLCFPRIEHLLMISWLKNLNCKVGVATNSISATSVTMLGFAGLIDLIDTLVTNESVKRAKPYPDIYLLACANLGVEPAQALVVEDNDYGVKAARDAGCQVIQVSGIHDVNSNLLRRYFSDVPRERGDHP